MSGERGSAPGGGGGAGGGPGAGLEDRTLYVGNLPYDVTQQEVSSLFTDNALPPPVRTHLPVGPDGRLRGFGFVTCSSSEAANQALATLRNLDVRGRRLMVNIAHPRGERPAGGPGVRPPRTEGGFAGGGEARFTPDAPPSDASARAIDGRRARNFGPPAPPGGGGGDWDDKKKKKKGRKGGEGAAGVKRERGGGGRHWNSDPDDE
jgi:nucleolin